MHKEKKKVPLQGVDSTQWGQDAALSLDVLLK